MRRLAITFVLIALSVLASAGPVAADTRFGVRGGYYTDIGEPFVGIELLTPVAHDVYFWAGAGLGWSHFDFEGPGDSDDDLVVNLLTGAGVNAGGVIPYVQFKLIIQDNTEFAIAVGLRF